LDFGLRIVEGQKIGGPKKLEEILRKAAEVQKRIGYHLLIVNYQVFFDGFQLWIEIEG
jgi:hypothetical protein